MRAPSLALAFVLLGCRSEHNLETGVEDPPVEDSAVDLSPPPPPPDADADTIPDAEDNCVDVPNADQGDLDDDGAGDACDDDADDDGSPVTEDCDDLDPERTPGAEERCDGKDNDCDGIASLLEEDFTGDGLPDCTLGTCTRMGMTWKLTSFDDDLGTVRASCYAGDFRCNPYQGNLGCEAAQPLLCLEPAGLPDPGGYGNEWSGGRSAITEPISGCQLSTYAAANAVCAGWFGPGWRVAEWHDLPDRFVGNRFWSYGDWRADDELWVDINDQPAATCWTRP